MEGTEIYGRRGSQLVKELACAEPGQLTRFNDDLFNQVIKECAVHYSQFYELTRKMQDEGLDVQSARNADHFGMLIHHLSLLRNKRCLMAYVHNRSEIIQNLSWKVGRVLPEEIEHKLSDPEKRYFKSHSSALQSYMREMDGLDLTVDMVPPKDPYIKVRVLDDIGVTAMGDRDTNLARHSIHFLKRSDAEHYMFQGMMEELLG
ncbi:DNA replication complex GINS protein PSF1-like [Chenopodium quinoa]|uniref:GINS subunit domain-containing protein n=1 Tax=Chenopodium quinoa TaxID=63459 RepID=A0A803KP38_CHEQI|nr:DNA replication complex GINS protein PSF1-like [Chenopodium quinoa]